MPLDSNQNDAAATAADDFDEFEAAFTAKASGTPDASDEVRPNEPTPPAPAGTEIAEADASPNEAAPATEGAPSSSDDPWATAPEQLRAAFEAERQRAEAAEHRLRSNDGRVASLNTQLRTVRQELEQERGAKGGGDKPAKLADILASDDFKSFKENFGADMGPLISALEATAAETGNLSAATGSLAEADAAAREAANMALIETAIPGWQDKMAANQAAFKPWLDAQPQHIQEAFFRNEQQLTDPAQAIDVVQRFLSTVTPAPKPEPQRDARRSGQLDAAASVQTNSPTATTAPSDDFEAEFALAAAKRAQAKT